MVEKETSFHKIQRLTNTRENIRNVATSAHIHHGKTAFTDNLLAAAGMMAEKNAGNLDEGMTTWQHKTNKKD
jgi:translation elongation factor EF-G